MSAAPICPRVLRGDQAPVSKASPTLSFIMFLAEPLYATSMLSTVRRNEEKPTWKRLGPSPPSGAVAIGSACSRKAAFARPHARI